MHFQCCETMSGSSSNLQVFFGVKDGYTYVAEATPSLSQTRENAASRTCRAGPVHV